MGDEWTEEKCIKLIQEFRARPILWDQKDPFFFKKAMKPAAWEEIGDIINIDPTACKHKMVVLMSSFRREKAKIMHSITENNDDTGMYVYKSTWFAFKEMAFLMDKEMERKRQLTGEDDEDAPSIKKVIMQHFIQPPSRDSWQTRSPMAVKRELGKLASEGVREETTTPPPVVLQQISPPQPSASPQPSAPLPATPSLPAAPPRLVLPPGPVQTPTERDEEIKSFVNFIGNKMKRYSDVTKNAVQQAICDIIFKADQNYYDSGCYDKFTIIDSDTDPLDKTNYGLQNGTTIKEQIFSDSE